MGVSMTCMKETLPTGNRVSIENDKSIYHEKQSKELCALHALNNLFQDENAFSKKELDDVCYKLSPSAYLNPHKSMFGLGNYDINVIMGALQKREFDTIWFDKRKNVENLVLENIEGFILNIPTEYKWGMVKFPLKRKHWVTIRQVGQYYYNLDSKLDAPEVIGGYSELTNYLREQVKCKEKEIMLVVTLDVAKHGTWYRQSESEESKGSEKECENEPDSSIHASNENSPIKKANSNDINMQSNYIETENETKNVIQPIEYDVKPVSNGNILNFSSRQGIYQVSCDRRSSEMEITSHS